MEGNPIQQWAERTPPVTRGTMYTVVGASLVAMFSPFLWGYVSFCPHLMSPIATVTGFFLGPIVEPSIITQLFFLFHFSALGRRFEREYGSMKFIWLMALLCAATNVLVMVCKIALSFVVFGEEDVCSMGIVTFFPALVAAEGVLDPQSTSRIIICKLRKFVWPILFLLYAGLLLVSKDPSCVPVLCSIVAGGLFGKGVLKRFECQDDAVPRLEAGNMAWLTQQPGYVINQSPRVPFADGVPEDEEWGLEDDEEAAALLDNDAPRGQMLGGLDDAPLTREEQAAARAAAAIARAQRESEAEAPLG